jgi:hypothetical protein
LRIIGNNLATYDEETHEIAGEFRFKGRRLSGPIMQAQIGAGVFQY